MKLALEGEPKEVSESTQDYLDYHSTILEQQRLQAPVEVDNTLIEDAQELDEVGGLINQDVIEKTDAITALEAIANYISRVSETKDLDKHAIVLANVAIESLYEKAGIRSDAYAFSMESYDRSHRDELQGALENIKEKISVVFTFLKEKLVAVAKHIGAVINSFNRNMVALKVKLDRVEQMLMTAQAQKASFLAIKAEPWCEYLCYTQTGFDVGLTNVGRDVLSLIQAHSKMSEKATHKYLGWFTQHCDKMRTDEVFNSLKVSKDDFLLPKMTAFNRSVGLSTPKKQNIYFRSEQLPGGRAFYTQVENADKTGLDGVRMFEALDFEINKFDPNSYKIMKAKIILIVALPMTAWLHCINPVLGLAAAGATGAILNNTKIEGTGSNVKIDKHMVFETLTLDQIKHCLANVRQAITELHHWSDEVLQKPWKDQSIDHAIDEIMKSEQSTSNIKSYCNALVNLMTKLGTQVHTYAFKVLNAMLNFAEKSARLYA